MGLAYTALCKYKLSLLIPCVFGFSSLGEFWKWLQTWLQPWNPLGSRRMNQHTMMSSWCGNRKVLRKCHKWPNSLADTIQHLTSAMTQIFESHWIHPNYTKELISYYLFRPNNEIQHLLGSRAGTNVTFGLFSLRFFITSSLNHFCFITVANPERYHPYQMQNLIELKV